MHFPLTHSLSLLQAMPSTVLHLLSRQIFALAMLLCWVQSVPVPLQAPQCLSSLVRSTHVPLQLVWPAGQHLPAEQVPLQVVPQAPQFLASAWRSTQVPPQFIRPAAQQTPVWQEPLHAAWPGLEAPEIGAQVPGLAPLQASQAPLQAVPQQTPSMQLPLWHSLAALQVCPVFFLHDPAASQLLVPLQLSLSSALLILTQVPPPPVQAWQEPHEALPQQKPSTQAPLAHSAARLQV